jgi:pimeloyl-ACP methyl ester carboxylesterase
VTARRLVRWLAVTLGAGVVVTAALYTRDMRRAYQRINNGSDVMTSPVGNIEWAEGGEGLPVLVVHGSGGGFDQGALIARAALDDGFRWIAPSRFGYLRSNVPPHATFDVQAHAYAELLDHLHVDRVAVVALSHGGPSALLFAVLHPERVSSLTLISAGVAASSDAAQSEANAQGNALRAIFQRDYRYWMMTRFLRRQFLGLMGAPPSVTSRLTPHERQLTNDVVDFMNPVSPRAAGVRFDNTAAMPNERIAAVRTPTLILHAKDDTLQLPGNAEFAGTRIPNAELVLFEHGGHLLLAVEQAEIRRRVARHIRAGFGAPR